MTPARHPWLLHLLWALALAAPAPCPAGDYRDPDYDYFVTGDPGAPRPAAPTAGLALMGGGGNVAAAFRFLARHAGGGHIVVLGAVDDGSFDPTDGKYGAAFAGPWGPVVSTETIIFHNRRAAGDARVLAALRRADGIFLMGGDQANYLHYWKGTPVQDALNAHLRAGRPMGGSSAGLAVLGHYSYGALDGGSLESKDALADPYNAGVTLEADFLHAPGLEAVITDTHFSQRHRLGRLVTFVARLDRADPAARVYGLGVDERTALLIDGDGRGRLAAGSEGSAWLVLPQRPARTLAKGTPLSVGDLLLLRLDAGSSVDLRSRAVQRPAGRAVLDIAQGRLRPDALATPIFLRAGPDPGED